MRHKLNLAAADNGLWNCSGAIDLDNLRYPIVVAAAKLLGDGTASLADTLIVEGFGTTFSVKLSAMAAYRPSADRRAMERRQW